MTAWVLAQLDRLDLARVGAADDGTLFADLAVTVPGPGPVVPVKRGRGRPSVDPKSLGRLTYLAVASHDVDRIRQLWQQAYGRKNRHTTEGQVTAEEIAAARWDHDGVKGKGKLDVSVDDILTHRAKTNGRRPEKLIPE
ncbi:hypothetical protein [Brevundimonas sp. DC300-4]|uniref:hypothetical protein n=1 Tax=Brevundimonas sp. DC300-4 TaxID=2804594 RepID=UPI003CEAF323